jgi:hypothetical protein
VKIRIKGNSIRFRLTQTEMGQLAAGLALRDAVEFSPSARLVWLLEPASVAAIESSFDDATVSVRLPQSDVAAWSSSDNEGMYGTCGTLQIAVEKDFACQHRTGSPEESDAFPRPGESGGSRNRPTN